MRSLVNQRLKNRMLSALLAGAVFSSLFTVGINAETGETETASNINTSLVGEIGRDNFYTTYMKKHGDAAKPMEEITINAADYIDTDLDPDTGNEPVLTTGTYENVSDCLVWHNNEGMVTYEFDVATTGLYNIEAVYHPTTETDSLTGETSSNVVEIGILLDGGYPFLSAKTFSLDRLWQDATAIRKDSKDNDLRPRQIKYDRWMTEPIKDREGLFNEPYYFYLEAGHHTITVRGIKVLTAFKSFTFKNYETPISYDEIKPTESQINDTPALTTDNEIGSKTIFLQGENSTYKTASTLYATYDRTSYLINPSHPTKQRFNTVGADTWNKATQAITWDFNVPNDGYYRFSFIARQNKLRGFFTNRKVYIDGEVPCEELLAQTFGYDAKWYQQTLMDENGEDIYIFLKAGKHSLTLEAVPGDIGEVMQRLDEIVYTLNYYYRRILMITGPNPDQYNDYFVDREIPELLGVFQTAVDQLRAERIRIEELSQKAGSGASSLETLAVILERCIKKPDEIPQMKQTIKDSISAVSAWMRDYRDQPLELDFIEIGTVHEELANAKPNFLEQFVYSFNAFIGSFFEDYTVLSEGVAKSLNVWVANGRDQAIIVKELVEGDFNVNNTYGISAAINLVQGSILEATLAGKGPDIAVFIGGDFPIQLAARDLLVDLTQFKDYDQVIEERYTGDVTTLYKYRDGIYALPVSQNFPMLFYRTDIYEELGLQPPKTWVEFIDQIPTLQRSYLSMGLLPPSTNITSSVFESCDTFAMMVLQTGNNIYVDDLSKTTYDMQEIIDVFTTWTKFYTVYSFDQVYDPFTRFRTGEMPIMIQNYTFYNQLSVSAPEIKGLWDFIEVPGTIRADGTISHAANSSSSGAIIFNKVADTNAAWSFIKWFTSTDVQALYGQTIEALMGPMGRFDSANVHALEQLPWSTAEFAKISNQMNQTREIPIIPASYATTRHTKNALRAVVNDKYSPRYTLMTYNRDINAEITRKNNELASFEK